jgi:hypothetical protein
MRTAQDFAMKHSGQRIIRAVQRLAGYLLHPVMPDRASANDSEIAIPGTVGICHESTS